MDKTNALIIAIDYASQVRKIFNPSRCFLFGSQAKGTSNNDSDIDIAVVLTDYTDKMEILLQLMRLRRSIDSRIEPHPFRESEFKTSDKLVEEIIEHGFEIIN